MKKQLHAVAIDGPSGAGKSTLARAAAARLHFLYVDTGAIYRSIGWYALQKGISLERPEEIEKLLPGLKIAVSYGEDGLQHMLVNGEDVTDRIRLPEVSAAASKVAAVGAVRSYLLEMQRQLAREHDVIMDGRDIGTVVLPDATVKIFLTASAEARAQRRRKELEEKGQPADYETVLADIRQRDYQDTHREIAPLKQAEDAILVDTSDIDFDQSFALLKRTILEHI